MSTDELEELVALEALASSVDISESEDSESASEDDEARPPTAEAVTEKTEKEISFQPEAKPKASHKLTDLFLSLDTSAIQFARLGNDEEEEEEDEDEEAEPCDAGERGGGGGGGGEVQETSIGIDIEEEQPVVLAEMIVEEEQEQIIQDSLHHQTLPDEVPVLKQTYTGQNIVVYHIYVPVYARINIGS
jgi:hypothetical protein